MQDRGRQRGDPAQAAARIEIGHHRHRAGLTQSGYAGRIAGHGKNAKTLTQQGDATHADVAATDNQHPWAS